MAVRKERDSGDKNVTRALVIWIMGRGKEEPRARDWLTKKSDDSVSLLTAARSVFSTPALLLLAMQVPPLVPPAPFAVAHGLLKSATKLFAPLRLPTDRAALTPRFPLPHPHSHPHPHRHPRPDPCVRSTARARCLQRLLGEIVRRAPGTEGNRLGARGCHLLRGGCDGERFCHPL